MIGDLNAFSDICYDGCGGDVLYVVIIMQQLSRLCAATFLREKPKLGRLASPRKKGTSGVAFL